MNARTRHPNPAVEARRLERRLELAQITPSVEQLRQWHAIHELLRYLNVTRRQRREDRRALRRLLS